MGRGPRFSNGGDGWTRTGGEGTPPSVGGTFVESLFIQPYLFVCFFSIFDLDLDLDLPPPKGPHTAPARSSS